MRIISGKHRGRKISTINSQQLRPTTGFAREAVFNILCHRYISDDGTSIMQGSNVLDLFCGCGALALESLSRGASHITCIDIDSKHLEIVQENINHMQETDNATLIKCDATNLPLAKMPYNIIFLDPPYNKDLVNKTLHSLLNQNWLNNYAILVVEMAVNENAKIPTQLTQSDERVYGNSKILFLEYNNKE